MKPFIHSLILLLPVCTCSIMLWSPPVYSEECIEPGIIWEGDRLIDKATDQTIFVYAPDAEDISGFFSTSKTFPELPGWPIEPPGAVIANLTIGDIDNDGDMEVLFPIFAFDFYAYDHKGQLQDGWPIETHEEVYNGNSSMSLIDIDGNLDLEIFTVAWDSAYGWHHNGQNVEGWPRFIEENSPGSVSTPALCDCDQDNEIEIIHGTNELARHLYSLVYMWHENGELQNNWPQIVPDDEELVNSGVLESPAIGDFDFDGKLEYSCGFKQRRCLCLAL